VRNLASELSSGGTPVERQSGFAEYHGGGKDAQDHVLGYSQPSPSTSSGQALAGLFRSVKSYPGLTSWATFSRPFGTDRRGSLIWHFVCIRWQETIASDMRTCQKLFIG
jgi:hypothetical protein